MKNYIAKKGIKENMIDHTTPKGALIRVVPEMGSIVSVTVLRAIDGGSPVGAKGKMSLTALPGLDKLIQTELARREEEFLSKYPGIDELLSIINGQAESYEDMQRMMETESRVTFKAAPEMSVEDAKKMYPLAAAYLHLLALADADPSSQIGFIRRQAGEKAFLKIEEGSDIIAALAAAEEEIKIECESKEYRNHCSGL